MSARTAILEIMKMNIKNNLTRLSLIRRPYISLLRDNRSHAAFDGKAVSGLLDTLKEKTPVLDPMAGYGTLLHLCSRSKIPSVAVEINAVLYLWLLIRNPKLTKYFLKAIKDLVSNKAQWPTTCTKAEESDSFFLPEALGILKELYNQCLYYTKSFYNNDDVSAESVAAALIVPFCGRLSCCTESSNNPTWVKRGGIVIYVEWEKDFENYLGAIKIYLNKIAENASPEVKHEIIFGDCRKIDFSKLNFNSFITSPPYPNRLDYEKMFWPESVFCKELNIPSLIPFESTAFIGSTVVRSTSPQLPPLESVHEFMTKITALDLTKESQKDIYSYYYPYFANYFYNLYEAYNNILHCLRHKITGYIIIQNNYFHNVAVPVYQAISEIWNNFGYSVEIYGQEEVFHTGTLNPRARGVKAKQLLITLKISK